MATSAGRPPQFRSAEGDLDAEMVAIAGAIIRQRTDNFDPSTYHDRYQEALQQLIEANAIAGDRFNGCPETQPCAGTVRPGAKNGKKEANQKEPDRRQPGLLLPLWPIGYSQIGEVPRLEAHFVERFAESGCLFVQPEPLLCSEPKRSAHRETAV